MRTADGLNYSVDLSAEKFGAPVSIAHLAVFSFNGVSSDRLSIQAAADTFERDWRFELESYELEYGIFCEAVFRDGSKLAVSAWLTEPRDDEAWH